MNHKFFKTKKEIIAWLNKYKIENYTLVEDPVFEHIVNVEGSVNLRIQFLYFIPVKFGVVNGDFDCTNNRLNSLEFCPHTIRGDFNCSHNQLNSLEFCPQNVSGLFNCSSNQLISLDFCPIYVGDNFHGYENPALGKHQYLCDFFEVFKIHQETVIKKEKEHIIKQLGTVDGMNGLVNKNTLKI